MIQENAYENVVLKMSAILFRSGCLRWRWVMFLMSLQERQSNWNHRNSLEGKEPWIKGDVSHRHYKQFGNNKFLHKHEKEAIRLKVMDGLILIKRNLWFNEFAMYADISYASEMMSELLAVTWNPHTMDSHYDMVECYIISILNRAHLSQRYLPDFQYV